MLSDRVADACLLSLMYTGDDCRRQKRSILVHQFFEVAMNNVSFIAMEAPDAVNQTMRGAGSVRDLAWASMGAASWPTALDVLDVATVGLA
ncbi:hypothetical protein MUK42_05294 [Musa troglodytarum]|uniref:Uncharacterized protein n=1 Tax=Musa troglodytarum TaxID=320322 RepID=A0A9E7GHK1_9LILI|nr:hypothetical protein MUK42_05294 [Musa troglodytarum]